MKSVTCRWPCRQSCCACWKKAKVERVGGDKPIKVNVRVVVATHRNLEDLCEAERLSARPFPPHLCLSAGAAALARTPGGFPGLVAQLRAPGGGAKRLERKNLQEEASGELRKYGWPGNVANFATWWERLILLASEENVAAADVRLVLPTADSPSGGPRASSAGNSTGTLAERTEAFEKEVMLTEIRRHNFHMTNVARALGLERSHLYKKCQQLGIDLQSLRKPE